MEVMRWPGRKSVLNVQGALRKGLAVATLMRGNVWRHERSRAWKQLGESTKATMESSERTEETRCVSAPFMREMGPSIKLREVENRTWRRDSYGVRGAPLDDGENEGKLGVGVPGRMGINVGRTYCKRVDDGPAVHIQPGRASSMDPGPVSSWSRCSSCRGADGVRCHLAGLFLSTFCFCCSSCRLSMNHKQFIYIVFGIRRFTGCRHACFVSVYTRLQSSQLDQITIIHDFSCISL